MLCVRKMFVFNAGVRSKWRAMFGRDIVNSKNLCMCDGHFLKDF